MVRRVAAALALLAIVLQLALAATHHHRLVFSPPTAGLAIAGIPDGHDPAAPADRDDDCPICFGLAIAATLLQPVAFVLAAPSGLPVLRPTRALRLVVRRVAGFRSRAPPAELPIVA